MAGTCAAVSAARLGLRVALVQERPVLGGNASSEIHIGPYGLGRPRAEEIYSKLRGPKPFAEEKNLSIFLDMHACAVEKNDARVAAVIACHTSTGQRMRFAAPLFVDATGTVGLVSGPARTTGRGGRAAGNSTSRWHRTRRTSGPTVTASCSRQGWPRSR